MGFFSQTWFGIKKELSIFKHHPMSLLTYYLSAFVSIVWAIYFSITLKNIPHNN